MFTRLLPDDKARVGSFGDRITLSDKFTNDQNELIRALWLDLTPGRRDAALGRGQRRDDGARRISTGAASCSC